MPTDEEYQRQQELASGDDEADEQDDGGEEIVVEEPDESEQTVTGIPVPVDPRTLMMVVAVAVMVWLFYSQFVKSGSQESGPSETGREEQSETVNYEALDSGLAG